MARKLLWLPALAALLAFVSPVAASAQEYRGQIGGKILDPSGAVIPGAQITVTNLATNSTSTLLANDSGSYTVLYLPPGRYTVTVEATGFKKLNRQGLEVRVGDQIQLDLTLEIGVAQDIVNVTAEVPLLETQSATAGQVIDQKRISELPLSDGNPFILHRLVPGVAYIGDLKFSRPFDNGGTSDIRADGAPGVNEFTLDGSPNMASGGRVAFVPPSDVVQEFKVGTASFDAQDGHTAGASVNVTMKSGTNNLHGTLYEFVRNDKLSANDYFLNRGGQPRAQLRYNRYGGTVGGPIWLPKLDGRNRTFFFFGYEAIKDRFPEPTQETVPTVAQRNGDFSALLALGSAYQIYDPLTAVREGSRVRRQPFAGNIIPANRISAIAKKYLEFYPLPNQTGDREGRTNYLSPQVRGDDFHSESYRFDHQLTDKQRFFFRYTHNNRVEFRSNGSGARTMSRRLATTCSGSTMAALSIIYTRSPPTTVLNYRVGFQRFNEPISASTRALSIRPVSASHPRPRVCLGVFRTCRGLRIGGFSLLGEGLGGATYHNIYSFQPTLTKIFSGGHQIRMGYDFRSYRENSLGLGHAAGRYDFGTDFTRGPLDNSTGAAIGQQLAGISARPAHRRLYRRNASRANQTVYHGVFFQDDWKISSRLTLNLGLRYEFEGAMTERYNRNILTFDQTAASPIEAAARAAYALNPIPQIAPSDFKVKGGYVFVSDDHRGIWDPDM